MFLYIAAFSVMAFPGWPRRLLFAQAAIAARDPGSLQGGPQTPFLSLSGLKIHQRTD